MALYDTVLITFLLSCSFFEKTWCLSSTPDNRGLRISTTESVYTRRVFAAATPAFLFSSLLLTSATDTAQAKTYILNEDTGEYDEKEEADWTTTWKGRLDKMQSMSTDEIFMAGRGAGNRNLVEGSETTAQKKRRALAGCRDDKSRKKAAIKDTKDCTQRVLRGDLDFMLDAM